MQAVTIWSLKQLYLHKNVTVIPTKFNYPYSLLKYTTA